MPSINESKCVLVTGGTAGIGRGLAIAIADLPSKPKVIVTGRRKDRLQEIAGKCDGVVLEMDTDKESLSKWVEELLAKYPELDTVILNAGMQREFDFKKGINLDGIYQEMNVNYLAVISLIAAFLPHFLKRNEEGKPSYLINVSSALALRPAQWVPNYSASKAALHSFTISLQAQLHDTKVHVIEIIPPLVESELHDAEGTTEALSKFWMPLKEYIKLTLEGLQNGDSQVTAGMSKTVYEKYEHQKYLEIMEMAKKGKPF